MTPAARVQAAIELLDLIIAAAQDNGAAADTLIARYFKERRYAGSKDRRAVREIVYRAVRLYGDAPLNGRAAMIGLARGDAELSALFDGSLRGPAQISQDEPAATPSLIPQWIEPRFAALVDGPERAALLERAPLHIRLNPLLASHDDIISRWPDAERLSKTHGGYALPAGTDVADVGIVEVQDSGSQFIAQACCAKPGMTVLDLCAGAGGKTLALAADMVENGRGQGRLIAVDAVRDRLSKLEPRATRAGYEGWIEAILVDTGKEKQTLAPLTDLCDVVLIDAPCSGSGTWRRNPEARWRLTPERLQRIATLQARLLEIAAPLVKPGGKLVYAVCSLIDQEGRDQVQHFVNSNPSWRVLNNADEGQAPGRSWGGGTLLTPKHDGTDGFFFAVLEKA